MRIPPVPVRRMTARMFTNSSDGHFILDRPPDADGGTAPSGDRRRSMEEEARLILLNAVGRQPSSRNLASIIRSHFGPANGVDLELPPREPGREPPSFD